MTTNPGILPKGYKQIDEMKFNIKIAKLLDERESLYLKPQVNRLLR